MRSQASRRLDVALLARRIKSDQRAKAGSAETSEGPQSSRQPIPRLRSICRSVVAEGKEARISVHSGCHANCRLDGAIGSQSSSPRARQASPCVRRAHAKSDSKKKLIDDRACSSQQVSENDDKGSSCLGVAGFVDTGFASRSVQCLSPYAWWFVEQEYEASRASGGDTGVAQDRRT